MAITERELEQAEARMAATRAAGHAVSARYDRRRSRVVVALNTGVELTFPTRLAEGLADASPDSLAEIEVSPAGLGLHWPKLDADLYVPALLQGVFGSKKWMARQLGAEGAGRAPPPRSPPRARTAARVDGRARPPRPDAADQSSLGPDLAGCSVRPWIEPARSRRADSRWYHRARPNRHTGIGRWLDRDGCR